MRTRGPSTCACMTSLLGLLRPAGGEGGGPEWHAQPAADACRGCCVQYRALSLESIRNGRSLCWKRKPKMHLFQEISQFQFFFLGNGSIFWIVWSLVLQDWRRQDLVRGKLHKNGSAGSRHGRGTTRRSPKVSTKNAADEQAADFWMCSYLVFFFLSLF